MCPFSLSPAYVHWGNVFCCVCLDVCIVKMLHQCYGIKGSLWTSISVTRTKNKNNRNKPKMLRNFLTLYNYDGLNTYRSQWCTWRKLCTLNSKTAWLDMIFVTAGRGSTGCVWHGKTIGMPGHMFTVGSLLELPFCTNLAIIAHVTWQRIK